MDDILTITVRSERGVVIAAVTGEIDISTVAPLRERLFELADSGGTLIIDLKAYVHGEQAGAEGHVVARAAARPLRRSRRSADVLCAGSLRRINHVGGCFDDFPEGTVGTVVVDAPSVVWAQFLQHAEADEPTEFLSRLSLQDHLAGWFGLVET
jgi:hypothetical protein